MKHICIGITAHVDAGKTTLSEAMLYQAGALKKLGRVDHRDAFLDTFALERERGITIFSKQAEFSLPHTGVKNCSPRSNSKKSESNSWKTRISNGRN